MDIEPIMREIVAKIIEKEPVLRRPTRSSAL